MSRVCLDCQKPIDYRDVRAKRCEWCAYLRNLMAYKSIYDVSKCKIRMCEKCGCKTEHFNDNNHPKTCMRCAAKDWIVSHRRTQERNRIPIPESRNCLMCKEPFKPKHKTSWFCCTACSNRGRAMGIKKPIAFDNEDARAALSRKHEVHLFSLTQLPTEKFERIMGKILDPNDKTVVVK